jgi:hypothetical protein
MTAANMAIFLNQLLSIDGGCRSKNQVPRKAVFRNLVVNLTVIQRHSTYYSIKSQISDEKQIASNKLTVQAQHSFPREGTINESLLKFV